MQLNYFRGLTDCEPKTTTLEEVVRLMTDDMSVRDLTEKYRYYLSIGDEYSTRRCKSLLPCFAVAVHFSGGKHNKHIVDFTGLTIVDIDHVPPEEMPRVLTIIREAPPHATMLHHRLGTRNTSYCPLFVFAIAKRKVIVNVNVNII